jgi:hypothetical protein
MNNQDEYTEDLLRRYIAPEMIEKAPDDFTSKVMMRLQTESLPASAERSRKINPVPVISAAVTVILMGAALLLPGNETGSITHPFLNLLKNIRFSIPDINLTSVFKITFPSVMIYIFLGILVLTVFDRALYGIFHREGKTEIKS